MKEFLLAMGATEHSDNIFMRGDRTVCFRNGEVVIEQWKDAEEDDHSGYYVEISRHWFPGGLVQDAYVPYFFHITGVVSLAEYINQCAKGTSISDKRAVYHLREAVRRLAEKGGVI